MSADGKLAELISICLCGVHIEVNPHRDLYESVETHIQNVESFGPIDLEPEVRARMVDLNTIVHVQCYPDTPVGFFSVWHHDLSAALDMALGAVKA